MIKFSFVGDISLGEHYFSFGHGPRSLIENGEDIFESVSGILKDCDFVVGNLEGPISDIGYDKSSPQKRVFRGHPDSAERLKDAHFNVINVANNHFIQHGFAAAKESIELLLDKNITVIGLAAEPIKYIQIEATRIAFIGCSIIPDNTDPHQDLYFSPTKEELLAICSQAVRLSDIAILYIHWGKEGNLEISKEQKSLAKAIHDCGINILVGHHTHSLQPVQREKNKVTAYSLGNFVFDLPWSKTNIESAILFISYENSTITELAAHSVKIMPNGKPQLIENLVDLDFGTTNISTCKKTMGKTEPIYKLLYFITNLFRGDTLIKLKFLMWKIKSI